MRISRTICKLTTVGSTRQWLRRATGGVIGNPTRPVVHGEDKTNLPGNHPAGVSLHSLAPRESGASLWHPVSHNVKWDGSDVGTIVVDAGMIVVDAAGFRDPVGFASVEFGDEVGACPTSIVHIFPH